MRLVNDFSFSKKLCLMQCHQKCVLVDCEIVLFSIKILHLVIT